MARTRNLHLRALAAAALLATASLHVACKDDKPAGNGVDAAPAAPSATPAASAVVLGDAAADAAVAGEDRSRRGHGGPSAQLFQVARTLELKDEQKAKLDAAEKSAHDGAAAAVDGGAKEATRDAAKELHRELVSGIKAGKVDTTKLEPHYAALEKLATVEREREATALNALHAALDATQRKEVVTRVRAKTALRDERQNRMREGLGAGLDGGRRGPNGKRSVDRLVRDLDLDAEQQKKVDAIALKDDGKGRPDPVEMKKRTDALLAAFEKDTFDAKKVEVVDPRQGRAALEAETKLLVQLVPILKPEQREKLAASMERGPSPHPRRNGFGHKGAFDPSDDD